MVSTEERTLDSESKPLGSNPRLNPHSLWTPEKFLVIHLAPSSHGSGVGSRVGPLAPACELLPTALHCLSLDAEMGWQGREQRLMGKLSTTPGEQGGAPPGAANKPILSRLSESPSHPEASRPAEMSQSLADLGSSQPLQCRGQGSCRVMLTDKPGCGGIPWELPRQGERAGRSWDKCGESRLPGSRPQHIPGCTAVVLPQLPVWGPERSHQAASLGPLCLPLSHFVT